MPVKNGGKRSLRQVVDRLLPLLSLALVLVVWLIAAAAMGKEILLPTPGAAFRQFFGLLGQAHFWSAVGGTVLRALYAFALSLVCATAAALLSCVWRGADRILSPIVGVLRALPTMSVILLSLIWFNAQFSPVFIAFLILFPLEYAGFRSAFYQVDGQLVELSQAYRVPFGRRLAQLYLPAVLPGVLETSAGGFSLGVKVVISAEVLAQTRGSMGMEMQLSRLYLDTALLMGWTLAAVLIGLLFEGAFALVKGILRRRGYAV